MLGLHLRRRLEPADTPLQARKRQRPRLALGPGQNLAVEHTAIGQIGRGRFELGETALHEVFAARPDMTLALATDELGAYAVPFPFRMPVAARAQIGHRFDRRLFDRRRQEERVRLGSVLAPIFRVDQAFEELRRGLPAAHQSMGDPCGLDSGRLGQRPGDQPPRHAHAKRAGEQLVEGEARIGGQLAPEADDTGLALVVFQIPQRQNALLYPVVQGDIQAGIAGFDFIEQQGDGFGQIADRRIAFLDQPERHVDRLGRPFAQPRGGNQPLDTPAAQKRHRPGRIRRRGGREIVAHGRNLVVGRGTGIQTRVQRGESTHG